MSMPASWVDALFSKLAVRYGVAFMRQYEGLDTSMVKADWAEQLSGFGGDRIAYGLANLPLDRPPTAAQFRAICLRAPSNEEQPKQIGWKPGPMPEEVRKRLMEVTLKANGGIAWAEKLRERELSGGRLTQFQREAWRRALREGEVPDDAERLQALKEEAARKVAEYQGQQ